MARKSFRDKLMEKHGGFRDAVSDLTTSLHAESRGYRLLNTPADPEQMIILANFDVMREIADTMDAIRKRSLADLTPYAREALGDYEGDLMDSFRTNNPEWPDFSPVEKYTHNLVKFGLLSRHEDLEGILTSKDLTEETKEEFLGHFSIMQHVAELSCNSVEEEEPFDLEAWYKEATRLEEVPTDKIDEFLKLREEAIQKKEESWKFPLIDINQWYNEVTTLMQTTGVEETKEILSEIVESCCPVHFSKYAPTLIEKELDFVEYTQYLPIVAKHNLDTEFKKIRFILEADIPNEEKDTILKIVKDNPTFQKIFPIDTLDVKDWLERAQKKLSTFVNDAFGLKGDYSEEVNLRVLNTLDSRELGDVMRQILRLEEKGEYNLAKFMPGKIHGERKANHLENYIDPVVATRLLITGLIGRNPVGLSKAQQLFDNQTLANGRIYIAGHASCLPKSLFGLLKPMIQIMDGPFPYSEKISSANDALETIKDVYFTKNNPSPGKDALHVLLNSVKSLSANYDYFDHIVTKMQDYTLMDMFGGSRLKCCTLFSKDQGIKEAEAVYYQADPFIGLEQIIPYRFGVPAGDPIGVSILANCVTENGTPTLLVDSAEGGKILQSLSKKVYLPLFLEGIIGAAEDSESELVFVPKIALNNTAQKFRNYFRKKIGQKSSIGLHLSKMRDNGMINTPREKRYLEAFKNKEQLSETIQGYSISLGQLKQIR